MGKQQIQTRKLSSCCLESARTPDVVNISHKLKQNCGFYNCCKDTVDSSMDLARKFREGFLREVIIELNLNNSAKRSDVSDGGVGVGQQS